MDKHRKQEKKVAQDFKTVQQFDANQIGAFDGEDEFYKKTITVKEFDENCISR